MIGAQDGIFGWASDAHDFAAALGPTPPTPTTTPTPSLSPTQPPSLPETA
jgi:hypothetical protein